MTDATRAALPGTPRASLAVIIVSYNVRELLRACLAAAYASLAHSQDLDASIWVMDNASADGSAEMVAQAFPQAHLIASAENVGFSGGNNLVLAALGFGSAGAEPPYAAPSAPHPPDFVLLLNPDAEPVGDAIGQMAGFLAAHPRVGGVGAQLQYPGGAFQHGAFAFPGLLQLWFDLFPPRPRRLLDSRLNGRYPRRLYASGQPFAIDFALGASLMVRREAILAAGLLDEGYFMYAEEVDWCWRIQRAGWPFFCVPSARVIHHGGASTRQFRAQSFENLWRSRRRLYDRFYSPLQRRLAGWIVALGMRAELARVRAAARRGDLDPAESIARQAAACRTLQYFK